MDIHEIDEMLEEKSYRKCIDYLLETAAFDNADSKKMYARVLLECLLAEDATLEEIFHPSIMKYGYYKTSPLKMKKVLMKEKLEKDYLQDVTSQVDED
tara:strand:- start:320 stop:613 length:294 start_codon:yes stop_codon:yes gene_type:complete